jgi:hypothetical protein
MMKRAWLAALVLALPSSAPAAVLELHAALRAGASTGTGIGGAQKDADFFAGARGATYGAVVGLEVLWIDIALAHDQFTDFSTVTGTWTQLTVGPHFAFPLNEPPPGDKPSLYADLGLAAGFGVGTGQQIDPPLDNAQISDKGVMIELKIGIEKRLGKLVGLGLTVPLTWGYMFKNDVVNDLSNHYQTFHAMALATLTFRVGL